MKLLKPSDLWIFQKNLFYSTTWWEVRWCKERFSLMVRCQNIWSKEIFHFLLPERLDYNTFSIVLFMGSERFLSGIKNAFIAFFSDLLSGLDITILIQQLLKRDGHSNSSFYWWLWNGITIGLSTLMFTQTFHLFLISKVICQSILSLPSKLLSISRLELKFEMEVYELSRHHDFCWR